MSVYSGFGTRLLEKNYNTLVEYCFGSLVKNIMTTSACLEGGYAFGELFSKKILKAFTVMKQLESQKYLKPHFSKCIEPMINYINSHHDFGKPNSGEAHSSNTKSSFFAISSAHRATLETISAEKERISVPSIKPNKINKFLDPNSLEMSDKSEMKIKNVNLSYYGLKPRNSSRRSKKPTNMAISRRRKTHLRLKNIDFIQNEPIRRQPLTKKVLEKHQLIKSDCVDQRLSSLIEEYNGNLERLRQKRVNKTPENHNSNQNTGYATLEPPKTTNNTSKNHKNPTLSDFLGYPEPEDSDGPQPLLESSISPKETKRSKSNLGNPKSPDFDHHERSRAEQTQSASSKWRKSNTHEKIKPIKQGLKDFRFISEFNPRKSMLKVNKIDYNLNKI
ncbi:unnamed protein product [Moneuplotes crassus]|uniref:Uncharacterized protein n=1 Tax=Euplotes crassus TaxID=5936 RepID=A0AAD1UIW9_EUPCR|nr:unnamed protein product [Moneuplotes crassus]